MKHWRAAIYEEIDRERERQEAKWGSDFDDQNTVNDWCSYFVKYAVHAAPLDKDDTYSRRELVKLAALAAAAIEAHDRNGGFPPRHYDSQATSASEQET